MFAAISTGFRGLLLLTGYAVVAFMIYLVVTGLAFPLIYGGVEIINSIGRFLIACYLFFVAAILEAITPTAPAPSRYDPALIDDNERRSCGARDAGMADAALIHVQQQQELAWWINHRG
jgi:apolipoprotein N-acyltransferase